MTHSSMLFRMSFKYNTDIKLSIVPEHCHASSSHPFLINIPHITGLNTLCGSKRPITSGFMVMLLGEALALTVNEEFPGNVP